MRCAAVGHEVAAPRILLCGHQCPPRVRSIGGHRAERRADMGIDLTHRPRRRGMIPFSRSGQAVVDVRRTLGIATVEALSGEDVTQLFAAPDLADRR